MLDINLLPFDAVFTLVGEIDDTEVTPDVTLTWPEDSVGPYIEEEGETDVLVTEIALTASAQFANTGGAEAFYLTGGTVSATKTRQITYTTVKRGIPNGDSANPPTQTETDRYRQHKEGRVWLVSETTVIKDLNNTVASVTTNETVTAGEALDSTSAALSISRHTDTKYYKYHSTNYPNLQGVLEKGQTIALDASFTLVNLKGTSTAHTGLTEGARYFAEDTGALTVTESATTEFIGKARTSTILDHALSTPPMTIASQAEAEAGTDDVKVMTPLKTKQAIDANPASEFDDSLFRIQDNGDATKEIAFEASGITTGTTRTLTAKDKDYTIADEDDLIQAITIQHANISVIAESSPSGGAESKFTGFDTEADNSYAPFGLFTPSHSSDAITVPKGGKYKATLNFQGRIQITSGAPVVTYSIRKNGSILVSGDYTDSSYASQSIEISDVDVSDNQYFEMYIGEPGAGAGTIYVKNVTLTVILDGGIN